MGNLKSSEKREFLAARAPAITPFLKWAGGKRWLISQYSDIFPESFDTYYEPFLGSAAVFFYLKPAQAVLADANKDLIETYQSIRRNWRALSEYLSKHQRLHSRNHFYRV